MNSKVVQYLVPDFRRCPRLRSIVFPEAPAERDAVTSILNRLHAFNSIDLPPLKIKMDLPNFNEAPTFLTEENSGKRLCWSRVTELRLKLFDYFGDLRVLANWLPLFPFLEDLEIVTREGIPGKVIVDLCRHQCANFKSLTVSYPDHMNWATWYA